MRIACAALLPLLLAAAGPVPASGPSDPLGPDPGSLRAAPSAFHTELRATYPAADTVHEARVGEIRLRFSTAVQLALSTVTVLGPGGVVRDADSLRWVDGSGEAELRLPLAAPLETGAYTVEWRTAGPDGHPIRGDFDFRVVWTPPAPPTAGTAGQDSAAVAAQGDTAAGDPTLVAAEGSGGATAAGNVPSAVARWLIYLAMSVALGGAAFRTLVLGRVGRTPEFEEPVGSAGRRLTVLTWIGALAGLVALPALLGLQAVQVFGEGGLAPGNLARLIGSPWGGAWSIQALGIVLLLLGLALVHRGIRRPGWGLAAAAGLVIALGAALGGHARAEGGWLPVGIQTVHAAAAAVWTGGVAALALAAVPAGRRTPASLARFVSTFSPVALAAVAVLLLTGLANAWDRVGGVGALFASDYGRVLLAKLALVAVAAAFGLHNRRTVRPALEENPRIGLIRMPATMELVFQALVLLATGFLVAIPAPGL